MVGIQQSQTRENHNYQQTLTAENSENKIILELNSFSIRELRAKLIEKALKAFPDKIEASKALGLPLYRGQENHAINIQINKYVPYLRSRFIKIGRPVVGKILHPSKKIKSKPMSLYITIARELLNKFAID